MPPKSQINHQPLKTNHETKVQPNAKFTAQDFRRDLPDGITRGSAKRHKLSCEIMAAAVNRTRGRKPSSVKIDRITRAISGPDNVHVRGGPKENQADHEVDSSLIIAHRSGSTVVVTRGNIPHLQDAVDVVIRHQRVFGPGITNKLLEIYGCARNPDGGYAVHFTRM